MLMHTANGAEEGSDREYMENAYVPAFDWDTSVLIRATTLEKSVIDLWCHIGSAKKLFKLMNK